MENQSTRKSPLTRLIEAIAVVLLFALVALVTMQVFMRYVMQSPLTWSEELARMVFIWFVFVGAGLGFRDHLDLRVVFFTEMLPPRPRLYLQLVVHLVEVAFMGVVLYYGWILCLLLFPTPTPALYWSEDTFVGGVVAGGAVILFYALMRAKEAIDALHEAGRSK